MIRKENDTQEDKLHIATEHCKHLRNLGVALLSLPQCSFPVTRKVDVPLRQSGLPLATVELLETTLPAIWQEVFPSSVLSQLIRKEVVAQVELTGGLIALYCHVRGPCVWQELRAGPLAGCYAEWMYDDDEHGQNIMLICFGDATDGDRFSVHNGVDVTVMSEGSVFLLGCGQPVDELPLIDVDALRDWHPPILLPTTREFYLELATMKEKELLDREQSEIIKFAEAGRADEDYAAYLSACWNVGFAEALEAIRMFREGKEVPDPLNSAIMEDARAEFYS